MQSETHAPTREEALALVREYITTENLLAHVVAVEAVMRYMARKLGEDIDKWGVIGLAHDIDYEKFPELHCRKSPEILRAAGWPEDYIHAVVSHGWQICSEVEPTHRMEKVLYAIDELTGLVVATALMRPSRSVHDLEARSVLKKWKNERFAAGVKRPVIEKGAAMLGVGLEELVTDTIMGMRDVAREIGLEGNPGAGGAGAGGA
ncbi:MAG TPA: HDIG domain-containing protein [Spirochaetia bacterium]|nr:HDIG domain-containing protein [Spirochaetia bacterium]